ncbi:metallophosphoesterase family protein [Pannonibacter sp. Q-1]
MRIAVISDVHGNLIALDAVLDHIARQQPDAIVNLGDLVSGPYDPHGSAERQMRLAAMTLAGNHERQLLEGGTGFSDSFAGARITQAHMDWIASLPQTLTLADGEVFACHGSPAGGDLDYLLEDISRGFPVLDTQGAIASRIAGIGGARVVLCGHTHIPRLAWVEGVLIVNPGSVGMPAYEDDTPVLHVMEAGTPHARYAMVERMAGGWAATFHAIPYDFAAAADQARQAGREATATATLSGRMR